MKDPSEWTRLKGASLVSVTVNQQQSIQIFESCHRVSSLCQWLGTSSSKILLCTPYL